MAIDFSFSSGGGFGYGHGAFFDFFYFASFEEVIIFMAVFMIGFIVAYTGLKKFFSEDQAPGYYPNKAGAMVYKKNEKAIRGKNALIVLSLCVSLLMTIGLLRNGWLFYYFGDIAGIVLSVIVLMILIVLIAPFYKAVEKAIGPLLAGILMGPAIWFILKMVTPYMVLVQTPAYFDSWHTYFIGIPGLVVLTLFFVAIGLFRNRKP
tara:strand:- start:42 stop:659 length:618 start_codon:yes stop_codon:yes gene_type:complete